MSRVRKYNQWVIAILGSLTICAVSLIILIGSGEYINEKIRSYSRDNRNSGITLDTLRNKNLEILRDQEITFNNARLVDSLKSIYIVPVSSVNLELPEKVSTGTNLFFDNSTKFNVDYSGTFHYHNLIIYSPLTGEKRILFERKLSFRYFETFTIKDKHYVIFLGTQRDSNNDNKLNHRDLQDFFIYDITSQKTYTYSFPNSSAQEYQLIFGADILFLYFSIDKNLNGAFDYEREPNYIKQVSLVNFEIHDFLDTQQIQKLQKTID